MSSLSPIGSSQPYEVSGITPTTAASQPPAPYLMGTLDGVANMLSTSTSDLQSALKQGSSISDLAAQKGVSRSSLVQYIEQQVQQRRSAQGKPPIDQQALDQVVNRALDRHRHHRGQSPLTAADASGSQSTTQDVSPSQSIDLLA